MSEPSAKVVLDSVSPDGYRLTTIEAKLHRFVLAELNTHRAFSRNSASSRAIPVRKQIKRVMEDPAIPLQWPVERPGMVGEPDPMIPERTVDCVKNWLQARDHAVEAVMLLINGSHPVHKSVVNRILEPWMWHTVIITATEWENFFGLRCHPAAMPEMRSVAEEIRRAYVLSTPTELPYGRWHTPYVDETDFQDMMEGEDLKVSAARCARVSYLTHDGIIDIDKDKELYDKLTNDDPPHASPLEHVARPCPQHWWDHDRSSHYREHKGNFVGWDQLRHTYI